MAKTKTSGYYQDKDGKWTIDTKVKVDGVFRHFKKSGYPTLSAAKADFYRARAEFISSKSLNKYEVIFFDDLVVEYERMRSITVDVSTVERDRYDFKNYMFPYFSRKLIKDVFTSESIYKWFHNLVGNENLSNNKKSKIITRMKDLLKFAYMHKYIDPVVYQDCDVEIYQVKYSKKPKTERVVWTEDEEKSFLEAISANPRHDLMFRVFLLTSPRLGEFLGLQPSCFDRQKNRITIEQQVKNVLGKGSILTGKLKTNESYRTIAIPKDVSLELAKYIDDFDIKDNQFLWFVHDKNKPIARNTIRRLFEHYCEVANVRPMNLHALRHNQAVKLAAVCRTGEELEVAARRLGHSPSMFMNTYANHANERTEKEILDRLLN